MLKIIFQRQYHLILILCSALAHSGTLIAEPEVSLNPSTNTISITARDNTPMQILEALAKNMEFSITGSLENNQDKLTDKFTNKLEKIIKQLIQPQSVAIVYTRDDAGNQKISSIELIPTGTIDTKYTTNAGDGARPWTGSQDQIEKRIAHDQRRAENRAKKLEEGSLVWTPEGKQKLEERMKKVREDKQQTK